MKLADKILNNLDEAKFESKEDKIKVINKKSIITFKKPIVWKGEKLKQLKTVKLVTDKKSGRSMIQGTDADTPWFDSVEELLDIVDWKKMSDFSKFGESIDEKMATGNWVTDSSGKMHRDIIEISWNYKPLINDPSFDIELYEESVFPKSIGNTGGQVTNSMVLVVRDPLVNNKTLLNKEVDHFFSSESSGGYNEELRKEAFKKAESELKKLGAI